MGNTWGIDWQVALGATSETGSCYMTAAVPLEVRQALLTTPVTWEAIDDELATGVSQQYTYGTVDPTTNDDVGSVCAALSQDLRSASGGTLGLDDFELNEATFHRYASTDRGISRHTDMSFYHYVIVGITLDGTGDLHLYEGDSLATTWQTQPGDLYLFRAPGLAGCEADARPPHATGATPGRTSLTLRYNSHGYLGGWSDYV